MGKFETLEDYQNSLKEFNERTRKSYEDFIQENGDDSQKLQLRCTPYTEKKGRYGVASLDFGFQLWQSRQAEVDQLQSQINEIAEVGLGQEIEINNKDEHARNLYYENANLQLLVEEKDKRIEAALVIVTKMAKATNSTAMWAYDLEKALRGEHEA